MAFTSHSVAPAQTIGALIKGAFVGFFDWLVALAEANQRVQELDRLTKLSDDQLAALGLTRDRLFDHVFRSTYLH